MESNGSRSREKYGKPPKTNQVNSSPNIPQAGSSENLDPLDFLMSSDSKDEGGVLQVCVKDTGSRAQLAAVNVQGVPARGLTDSGADITIIGEELFKRVANVARLKNKDFRRADKTP